MRVVERELARLATAIATGGASLPPLVTAMTDRHARAEEIRAQIAAVQAYAARRLSPLVIRRRVEGKLKEWRELLGRQAGPTRELLRDTLLEPIRFEPIPGRKAVRFTVRASVAAAIEGLVELPLSVASPPGLVHRRGWRPNSIHRPPGVEASSVEFLNSAANVR